VLPVSVRVSLLILVLQENICRLVAHTVWESSISMHVHSTRSATGPPSGPRATTSVPNDTITLTLLSRTHPPLTPSCPSVFTGRAM
jgi:hypothetical protein